MWAASLSILKQMASALLTKAMLEWAIKNIVISLLEVAVEKYKESAAKTEDKADDRIARRFETGLHNIKKAWDVEGA